MTQLFANNCTATLSAQIGASDTSLVLANVVGSWPVPTGSDYFLFTFSQSVGAETSWEICKCTTNSSGILTIVRAQESTSAAIWPAGSAIQIRETAGTFSSKSTIGDTFYVGTTAIANNRASASQALTGITSIDGAAATVTGLSVVSGKTLTVNNSISLTGTDTRVYTFPTTNATMARTDAAQTFTGTQTFSGVMAGLNQTLTYNLTNQAAQTFASLIQFGETTTTATESSYQIGQDILGNVVIGAGLSNNGYLIGQDISIRRNSASDYGILSELYGQRIGYGHSSASLPTSATTNVVYGIDLRPAIAAGTVGTMYDLLLEAYTSTGGTVTTHYAIYQQSTTAKNYFAGTLNFANSTASTSTITGALTATGGIGCQGNIWAAGFNTAENTMSTSTTAVLGTWNRVTCGANLTITIPSAAANPNATIGIIVAPGSGNYLVTLQDAAGAYIDYDNVNGTQTGRLTRIMWAGESCRLESNGTYWHKIGGKAIPMVSALGMSGNQTFSAGVETILAFATNLTNNAPSGFQVAASNKFVILRPGIYRVDFRYIFNNTNSGATSNNYYIYQNTINVAGFSKQIYLANTYEGVSGTTPLTCAAGDVIQLTVSYGAGTYTTSVIYNDSGAGLYSEFVITEIPIW